MFVFSPKYITGPVLCAALVACSGVERSSSTDELIQRAQSGDVEAQFQLGKKYSHSIFSQGPDAIYWFCTAAKKGHVPAQLELATLYEKDAKSGNDVAADGGRLSTLGSAYFWYTAAASQGSEVAFSHRERLATEMDTAEVMDAKQRATRWQQAICVDPNS